jgi:hypothetical protein
LRLRSEFTALLPDICGKSADSIKIEDPTGRGAFWGGARADSDIVLSKREADRRAPAITIVAVG